MPGKDSPPETPNPGQTMRTSGTLAALLIALAAAGCGGASGHSSSSRSVRSTVTHTVTRSSRSTSTTAGASTAPTGQSSSAVAGTPPCRAAGLAVTFLGGQGATGHGLLGFQIRNTGAASCNTVGYPGVQFRSKSGAALPTHPQHTTSDFFGRTVKRELTLAPGRTASFRLGVSHVSSSGSAAGCTTAASVQVIAPNDTTPVTVAIPGGAYECGGVVTVSPMQPGDTAYH